MSIIAKCKANVAKGIACIPVFDAPKDVTFEDVSKYTVVNPKKIEGAQSAFDCVMGKGRASKYSDARGMRVRMIANIDGMTTEDIVTIVGMNTRGVVIARDNDSALYCITTANARFTTIED